MSYLTDLEAIRDKIVAALKIHAGDPSVSVDGETVSYDALMDRLEKIEARIAAGSGPVIEETQGIL